MAACGTVHVPALIVQWIRPGAERHRCNLNLQTRFVTTDIINVAWFGKNNDWYNIPEVG
jgi:hypothetical protein